MKTIIKYIANDGKEFKVESECLEYDKLIEWCNNLMSVLPELPKNDGCRFANGQGYIQHNKEIFDKFKTDVLLKAQDYIDHKWISETLHGDAHPSFAGKLIYESGLDPLYSAWCRVQNTDKNYREYGQMYYAVNPNQSTGGQINEVLP